MFNHKTKGEKKMSKKKATLTGLGLGAILAIGLVACAYLGCPVIGVAIPVVGFGIIGIWSCKKKRI